MKKNQTPSFIAELPLVVNSHQERQLLLIFEISRKLYNAALGNGLKKIRLMKQSKAWQAARLMKPSADKTNAFKEIISLFRFTKNDTEKGHKVGLDIGPSTIAAVATNPNNVWALFSKFCQSIEYPYHQIKLNNRAIERSKRATNPQCYNNDGGCASFLNTKIRTKFFSLTS